MGVASLGDWVGFHAVILVLLTVDLVVLHGKSHAVGVREAALESVAWVVASLAFNGWIWHRFGTDAGTVFLTGYLLEKSLSADNLFIFVLIFGAFRIPREYQHRVLFYGIAGAILMRAGFILAGSALVAQFYWILYGFGGFLVLTAVKMLLHREEGEVNLERNVVFRAFRAVVPTTTTLAGQRFWTREAGKLVATPLLVVLVLLESTDVLFAVDSIPAIFGITRDPYLIYTSNIMAILGLRALYFLLAALVAHMRYLKAGLAVVLGVIGMKMILETWDEKRFHVPPLWSLLLVLAILGIAALASWVAGPAPATRPPDAGTPPPAPDPQG